MNAAQPTTKTLRFEAREDLPNGWTLVDLQNMPERTFAVGLQQDAASTLASELNELCDSTEGAFKVGEVMLADCRRQAEKQMLAVQQVNDILLTALRACEERLALLVDREQHKLLDVVARDSARAAIAKAGVEPNLPIEGEFTRGYQRGMATCFPQLNALTKRVEELRAAPGALRLDALSVAVGMTGSDQLIIDQAVHQLNSNASAVDALSHQVHQARPIKAPMEEALALERERLCAAIKAADDESSKLDYMLDSDDCINVIRGTWIQEKAIPNPTWVERTAKPNPKGRP